MLSYLVETDIDEKGKDTLLVETGIAVNTIIIKIIDLCNVINIYYTKCLGSTYTYISYLYLGMLRLYTKLKK
jgi:hypothetical protein